MSISSVLQEISIREDLDSAQVIASLFNSDRVVVALNEGRREFTADDILRLGRIIALYNASPRDAAAAFAPSRVRPVAPSPAPQALKAEGAAAQDDQH